jgi:hypothetical protein
MHAFIMYMCVMHRCQSIKKQHQDDETVFDEKLASLKKLSELLGHHTAGSKAAKTRFEAMIA